jgi:hypothetical protein
MITNCRKFTTRLKFQVAFDANKEPESIMGNNQNIGSSSVLFV